MPASPSNRAPARLRLLAAAALAMLAPGCSSLLSTAALRDGLWNGDEHASEAAVAVSDPAGVPPEESPSVADAVATEPVDEARRAAAIEEAIGRLARAGRLDDQARGVLIDTLERTAPEDWPAVVEAFTESLPPAPADPVAELPPASATTPVAGDADRPEPHVVAKADLDGRDPGGPTPPAPAEVPPPATSAEGDAEPAVAEPQTVAEPGPEPPAADQATLPVPPLPVVAAEPVTEPGQPDRSSLPQPAPEPADPVPPPALAIRNACFASRVQAWGVVDRFAADRFRPGQELIVYFELDNLSSGATAAGHTTCIDSTLELLGPRGEVVHAWRFEPIAETCQAKRRDYFARYVVRIPAGIPPGAFDVAVTVTDTLAGSRASASLPLEIVPAGD